MVTKDEAVAEILREYSGTSLPHTVLVPSARFGLYALARILMKPGEAVALSPVTCRTVVHSFLQAGVRPYFLDIECESGNLDVESLSLRRLGGVRAIVTTNLYGNPDRVSEIEMIARNRGVLLIEDCAHVLRTRIDGRLIGSVGDAAVFSFRKYFGVSGGVVATADARTAEELRELVALECAWPGRTSEIGRRLRDWVRNDTTREMARVVRRLAGGALGPIGGTGAGGDARDGDARFRTLPDRVSLLHVLACLRTLPRLIEDRARQAHRLIRGSGLRAGVSAQADCVTYFALPFLTQERDLGLRRLAAVGIHTYFLYPPLHPAFAGEAAGMPLDASRVDEWSRQVLPVRLGYRPEQETELIACLEGLASDPPSRELAHGRDSFTC